MKETQKMNANIKKITIIGGGLAGTEAALQLADKGWDVNLYEMRPVAKTPAHNTDKLAEIVCSNSLKSMLISTASGLLKEEMRLLGCKLLPIAESCSVPAGNALAVDRDKFADAVTSAIESHPSINLIREEVKSLPSSKCILATGPLSSDSITESLMSLIGENQLYFFDAIAPIVSAESINMDTCYSKSRYDKGESDYINCPFTKEQYENFVDALRESEKYQSKEFENDFFENIDFRYYESCIPIEELARRNIDTLRYGVMRPVGLNLPDTDKRPYAVIQLRAENNDKTAYNLVGCQTMMKQKSQKEVIRMIPGLENAVIVRYGSIHRNSYINSPELINTDFSFKNSPNLYIAGQLAGVEGYIESILSGMLTAFTISDKLTILPETTISGKLWKHLITESKNYQPMNANFGLLPALPERIRDKKLKKTKMAERAIDDLKIFLERTL